MPCARGRGEAHGEELVVLEVACDEGGQAEAAEEERRGHTRTLLLACAGWHACVSKDTAHAHTRRAHTHARARHTRARTYAIHTRARAHTHKHTSTHNDAQTQTQACMLMHMLRCTHMRACTPTRNVQTQRQCNLQPATCNT